MIAPPVNSKSLSVNLWRPLVAIILLTSAAFAAEPPPDSPEKLAGQLASGDRDAKREAVYQLAKAGPAARAALPALIIALDDNDKQVWNGAIAAIATIGPGAADAVPALLAMFDNSRTRGGRDRDRQQALVHGAHALATIGKAALPALIESLSSDSPMKAACASRALGELGPDAISAAPALVKNLGSGDEPLRREAIDALGQIGAPAVQPLAAALDSGDAKTRQGAAAALGQVGQPAVEAAPALAALLQKESDVPARAAALAALPAISGPSAATVDLLMAGVRNDNPEVRHAAINGLLSSKAISEQAVPALTAELKSEAAPARQRAAAVLGRMGTRAQPAIPALIEVARKEPQENAFTDALAQIGTPALQPLVDQLSVSGTEARNREWVFRALHGMGSTGLTTLATALSSPTASIRAGAATALASMAVDSPPIIKSLLALTADKDNSVRAAALRAVATIRSERETVLPKLEAALTDGDAEVRRAAVVGLASIGAGNKIGVEGLIELLGDPDPAVQRNTLQSLAALGAGAKAAVPEIVKRLDVPELRSNAIETLGKVGEDAKPAIPKLTEFASSGPDDLRLAAMQALNGIGRPAAAALPTLYKAMSAENRDLRIQALLALDRIETNDDQLHPIVLAALQNETGAVRRTAAQVAKRFGDGAQDCVPALLSMLDRDTDRPTAIATLRAMKIHDIAQLLSVLDDRSFTVRIFVCEALAKLGPEAKEALPALQKKADGDIDAVKSAAQKAIEQINKQPGA